MAKPIFRFTSYTNSFHVFVENLEKLTVEQIQEIELFVKLRKGIFDFQTYSFDIQKRLEFYEFELLVTKSKLDALCIEERAIEKSEKRVGFGQYKGMLYSELPDSYILWLASNYKGNEQEFIQKEFQKRKL